MLDDRIKQPLRREEPVTLVDVGQQETTEKRLATDGVWRIDSDIEINLGRPHDSRPAADLDLRIPPRSGRMMRTHGESQTDKKRSLLPARTDSKHTERPAIEGRHSQRPEERHVAYRRTNIHSEERQERSSRRRERSSSQHCSDKRFNERSDLLPSLQSGFRPGHSTDTAALWVFSDILEAVDSGDVAALVLLDLSAAFDTVDHTILCRRLQVSYRLLDWFRSYLHGRSQYVRLLGLRGHD